MALVSRARAQGRNGAVVNPRRHNTHHITPHHTTPFFFSRKMQLVAKSKHRMYDSTEPNHIALLMENSLDPIVELEVVDRTFFNSERYYDAEVARRRFERCTPWSAMLISNLAHLTALRELTLTRLEMSSAFVTALSSLVNLRTLCLQYNQLNAHAASMLCAVMPRLRSLNLSGNLICDAGATAIAKCLPLCTALLNLDLSDTLITDAGCTALARRLNACKSLQYLSLSGNHYIGSEGAVAFAHLEHLVELNLAACCIGNTGAAALADALRRSASLRRLDLRRNSFTVTGARTLASTQEMHVRDVYIDLSVFQDTVQRGAQNRAMRMRVLAVMQCLDADDGGGVPLRRFLHRDGDNAIMRRALGMLLLPL